MIKTRVYATVAFLSGVRTTTSLFYGSKSTKKR